MEEEYSPCYECGTPVPHSAQENYRGIPLEPGEREGDTNALFCDDCLHLEER